MLTAELRKHRVEAGRLWIDVNHIGSNVSAACLQFLDFGRIRPENIFLGRLCGQWLRGFPDIVFNADVCQILLDRGLSSYRAILFRNSEYCHVALPYRSIL